MSHLPSAKLLELYYEAWLEGCYSNDIYDYINAEVHISKEQFVRYQPYFFAYVKKQMHKKVVDGDYNIPRTPGLEARFFELLNGGLPVDKVATIMNIPLITILQCWMKDPWFKAKVDYVKEVAKAAVIHALHKRATGFKHKLRSVTKTRTKPKQGLEALADDDGLMTIESETIREEYVLPSVEAAKFYLTNVDPDNWVLTGKGASSNEKGEILRTIEELSKLTAADKKELGLVDETES